MTLVHIPDRVQTKYEHVREALLRHIFESGLKVGDRMSSERKLAEITGLNRLTVRRAIKSLCDSGILRQVPKSGTFVNQIPPPPPPVASEPSPSPVEHDGYAADGSFFQTATTAVLRFHIEDIHGPQQEAWNGILAEFERRHPTIRIQPCYEGGQALQTHPENYDAALCIPRYLKKIRDRQGLAPPGFAPTWFEDHPLSSDLESHRELLIRAGMGGDGGLPGVPIMYNFDVLFVNRQLAAEALADHAGLPDLLAWAEATAAGGHICSPFTQATLNAMLRTDSRLLGDDGSPHLDSPECRRWIATQKQLLERQPALASMSTSAIIAGFLEGTVAACDLHSNALCNMAAHFRPGLKALGAVLSPLGPKGCAQIMPRYLAILGQGAPQGLALANFLAEPWSQLELARHHLGLPMYLGEDGLAAFCTDTPLRPRQIRQELSRVGGAFAHPLFISAFQANLLNPLLRMHLDGSISLDQLFHQLRQLPVSWTQ